MSTLPAYQHHATRAAERRKADRERKALARAAAKEIGIPEKSLVDHAVSEGVSFCIANADRSVWKGSWTPVNAAAIYAIALDVLVLRHHKDPEQSRTALNRRLGRQEGHSVRGSIPSTRPAPGQPKYRLDAPKDMSTRKSPAPPLPPQDSSAGQQAVQH